MNIILGQSNIDAIRVVHRDERLSKANRFLAVIAGCGRKFFYHQGRVSHFEIDARGRVWFVDAYREANIYTHYTRGRWRGFSEGGTLRDLVIRLRDFIRTGKTVGFAIGPFPEWYSEGDPWGYGHDMNKVYECALAYGIVEQPVESRCDYHHSQYMEPAAMETEV